MIDQFIKKTNAFEFYHNGQLHLTELKGQIGHFNTMEFNFIMEERNDLGNIIDANHWRLIAHNTVTFYGLFTDHYLPYIKLKILDDHPLLWRFHKPELECEIQGFPGHPSAFLGDLYFEYEQKTGHWLALNQHFFNLKATYQKYGKMDLRITEPLAESIKQVCEKHQIAFHVKHMIQDYDKGSSHRPNTKLLIFGNEDVSPNSFNLNQPYIIADAFIANKK